MTEKDDARVLALRKILNKQSVRIRALTDLCQFHSKKAKFDEYDIGFSVGLILAHAIVDGQYVQDPNCQGCQDGSVPRREKGEQIDSGRARNAVFDPEKGPPGEEIANESGPRGAPGPETAAGGT